MYSTATHTHQTYDKQNVFYSHTHPSNIMIRKITVVINSEAEKNQIIENLKELKGQESFRGISITDDYTLAQRQMIKEFSQMAKENNNKEPQHSPNVWRVRGSPKNSLRLKKFTKQGPVVPK